MKARGGDVGINRAASIAGKPWRSCKARTFLSLARRLAVQYMPTNVRVTAIARDRADVFVAGKRDESRLIVRADPSITSRC